LHAVNFYQLFVNGVVAANRHSGSGVSRRSLNEHQHDYEQEHESQADELVTCQSSLITLALANIAGEPLWLRVRCNAGDPLNLMRVMPTKEGPKADSQLSHAISAHG
jgi:hypothetical protein